MADWGNVGNQLTQGYQVGRSTGGGRLGGLGSVIKKVADRLKTERETGEAMAQKKNLLGIEGLISGKIEPTQQGGFELPGIGRVGRTSMEIPKGFEVTGYSTEGKPSIKKIKEPKVTETERYREDLRKAKKGEVSWDELKDKYPEPSKQKAIETVRKLTLPSLEKSPTFKFGKGLPAWLSKDKANIDATTMKVINNIASQEDFDELLNRTEEYKQAGVDVNAVLEYFGKRK